MRRVTWIAAVWLLIANTTPVVALDGAFELSSRLDEVVSLLNDKSPRLSILKSTMDIFDRKDAPSKADWERVVQESRTLLQSYKTETESIARRFGLWMAKYAPDTEDEDNIVFAKSIVVLIATVKAVELERTVSDLRLFVLPYLTTMGINGQTRELKESFDGCCRLIRLIYADMWGDTDTGRKLADTACDVLGASCLLPILACSFWNPRIDLDEYKHILGITGTLETKAPGVRL